MKIAIVGADSRKWAKIPDGEKKAKEKIRNIILTNSSYIYGKEVILVSGHCPVGEERWYCIDCGKYLSDLEALEPYLGQKRKHEGHKMLRIFDQGGVDTWAEIIATELGLKKVIYPAPAKQWNDKWDVCGCGDSTHDIKLKGYRSRNIQIAEAGILKNPRIRKIDGDLFIVDESGIREKVIGDSVSYLQNRKDDYVLYDIEPAKSCTRRGGCGGSGKREYFEFPKTKSGVTGFYDCPKCEGDGAYSGGTWTLKYARKLGREVHKVIIE